MVIYKITNLINNKIYIGKTIADKSDYFGSGILINRSIEKYGIEHFKKEIIDNTSSIEELNEKEKYWIKYFNSTDLSIGYNIGKGGDGGDIFTNHPDKEEIRKRCSKIGEKNGMFGRHHTKESIDKISKKKKGQNKGVPTWNKGLNKENYTEEHKYNVEHQKRNFIAKTKKTYIIFSPDRKIYEIYGLLNKFCKEHDLVFTTFRRYINKGIINKSRKNNTINREKLVGWEIRTIKYHKSIDKKYISQETKSKLKQKLIERCNRENNINAHTFYVISPENKIYIVKGGLPTFCKKHNINYYVMKRFINKGKIIEWRRNENEIKRNTIGWEIKTDINIKVENDRSYFILKSPGGQEYKLYNDVKNFCKEHNISYESLRKTKGKIKKPIKSFSEERINTIGWEMIKVN